MNLVTSPSVSTPPPLLNHVKHTQPNNAQDNDNSPEDADGWDTAFEGEEGEQDGINTDVGDTDDEDPLSSEERDRIRRLKGKQVLRVAQEVNAAHTDPHAIVSNHHSQSSSSIENDPHATSPPPAIPSQAPTSPLISPNGAPPVLPHSGPSPNGVQPFLNGHLPTPPPIPAVNVIPTSPLKMQQVIDSQRLATGSLDIAHSASHSDESLRRRETLGTLSAAELRNSRRRSMDPRIGANRLSGFFSNLLHIRDRSDRSLDSVSPATSPTGPSSHSSAKKSTGPEGVAASTDSIPVERPITPPPLLPPPSLRDLGLTMSAMTPLLSHPHYPSPPTSGVFLAPHYLLLCHNQGLDVLPLKSPPTTQPCALIRRVAFKSVVVMEARGILVAIAGRREAVRVYALEEVRKAVEWRLQVEIERERDKSRESDRDPPWQLKEVFYGATGLGKRSMDRMRTESEPLSLSPLAPGPSHTRTNGLNRTSSQPNINPSRSAPHPLSPPPTYASLPTNLDSSPQPASSSHSTLISSSSHLQVSSTTSLSVPEAPSSPITRSRNHSVSTVSPPKSDHIITNVAMVDSTADGASHPPAMRAMSAGEDHGEKSEWPERHDSDDDALDPVAAGSSGSAALDERTSAVAVASAATESAHAVLPVTDADPLGVTARRPSLSTPLSIRRQSRPSNLDLSATTLAQPVMPVVASPAPTLVSMRQALSLAGPTPGSVRPRTVLSPRSPRASTSLSLNGVDDGDASGLDTPNQQTRDVISFAQALQESRLPNPRVEPASTDIQTAPFIRSPVTASASASPLTAPANHTQNGSTSAISTQNAEDVTSGQKKQKRRFSVMGGVLFGKPGNLSKSTSSPRMPGASASTPNLLDSGLPVEPLPPRVPLPVASGSTPPLPSGSRLPPPPFARTASHSSMPHASGSSSRLRPHVVNETIDAIFQPQTTQTASPVSPIKPSATSSSRFLAPNGSMSPAPPVPTPSPRASRRFFPKLLTGLKRTAEDRRSSGTTGAGHRAPSEVERRLAAGGATSASSDWSAGQGRMPDPNSGTASVSLAQAPAPKLEYVKLPGTKGAIAVKAVETSKKSFLAILCGDGGEKIELFAGTCKTALGLSRTFILPDSPRSVELQLQGDDLVELFLVFGQNIFGLEPATVRVREVRIGRAERRAARRRAREVRGLTQDGGQDASPLMEDVRQTGETVVMTMVSAADDSAPVTTTVPPRASRSRRSTQLIGVEGGASARETPTLADGAGTPAGTPGANGATAAAHALNPEELAALAAAAQLGPYTTFQQLTHAPPFPLGVIADDCIIPPTYKDFLWYREKHEPDAAPIPELLSAVNTPPTLGPAIPPAPTPPVRAPPPSDKWFYVDPKGVTRGPWKTTLMQTWFTDGFLPPDLPVRRETDTEHIPLKDLCAKAKDADRPFQMSPDPEPVPLEVVSAPMPRRPLLPPISLLAQPKRFGPPALFYTSRGGHSTTIVDSRGKSVLRGRLNWTADDEFTKLGDVKRLEAFDARERAVIVALRQGGVEAVDVGDALFYPGDESRSSLPHFHANPAGISRRPSYMWRLGTSWEAPTTGAGEGFGRHHKRHVTSSSKKSTGSGVGALRGTSRMDGSGLEDGDGPLEEEIIYLGRYEDTIYFCERNAESFRIFSLGTMA